LIKAIKCQHVGYCETQKGLRAWDPVGRKVHISRNVIFHEKILPICQGPTVFDLVPELFIESELDHSDLPSEPLSTPPDIPVVDTDQMSPSEQQQEEATTHVRSALDVHLTESLPLNRKIKPVLRWSDESLTPRYAYLAGTNEVPDEPNTPEEAINSAVWKAAIMEELSSLERNDTWNLCSLPLGRKSIKCKWVFKLKQNADQFRCKARLVAKGFTQQAGIDYEETYSPVVRHDSLRVIFSVAAQKDLDEMVQLDVTTAFLNGDLKEELYMEQPTGFVTLGKEKQVYRLKKSLYGFKQSSRVWNRKFSDFLTPYGFSQCVADPCVFFLNEEVDYTVMAIWVDDGIICSSNPDKLQNIINYLNKQFEMTSGSVQCFVGIQIQRDRKKQSHSSFSRTPYRASAEQIQNVNVPSSWRTS
jgi:hypothetical protein